MGDREVAPVTPPDPEVVARHVRRRFTTAYKLEILRKADACARPGELGALLRREGLYSSHLVTWRRQREHGLAPKKRGRKPTSGGSAREEVRAGEGRPGNGQTAARAPPAAGGDDSSPSKKKVAELLGIP